MPRTEQAPVITGVPTLKAAARRLKAPLHSQIRQTLRGIIEKDFEDGDRFYTERDLIKHLGASLLTVRRSLADLVTEGLLERKVGSGSFVRKGGALRSVGVFVPDYSSPVFIEMLEALAVAARTARARLNVYHTHRGESVLEALGQVLSTPQEEGMLLLGNSASINLQLATSLQGRGFRVVLLNNSIDGLEVNCVGLDDAKTVSAGFDHLAALGHRRIVCLMNEPIDGAGVRSKHDAMVAALKSRKLQGSRIVTCGTEPFQDSFEAAYRAMPGIMSAELKPSAIFAVSDAGAFGALRFAYEQRMQVPRDLSVLGINNSPAARFSQPSLTTFALPMQRIAERALLALTRKEIATKSVWFPPVLVERDSTGPVP